MDTGWYQDGRRVVLFEFPNREEMRAVFAFCGTSMKKDANGNYFNQFTGGMLVGWQNVGRQLVLPKPG